MNDHPKAVVWKFYEIINDRSPQRLEEACSPDLRGHAGAGADLSQLKQSIGSFAEAFPDLRAGPQASGLRRGSCEHVGELHGNTPRRVRRRQRDGSPRQVRCLGPHQGRGRSYRRDYTVLRCVHADEPDRCATHHHARVATLLQAVRRVRTNLPRRGLGFRGSWQHLI
jgi:hypothetical protein